MRFYRGLKDKLNNNRGVSVVEYALILALISLVGITGMSNFGIQLGDTFEGTSCGVSGGQYVENVPQVPAFGFYSFNWLWQNDDGSGCVIISWSENPPEGGGDDGKGGGK